MGPAELHHLESQVDVLRIRKFFHLGFIQTLSKGLPYEKPSFRLTFKNAISALYLCVLKEAQVFKGDINEAKLP
ncbi:hypothetical protein EYF80_017898 [Liparis tanakae]|uniref:Uncharacterized protein n=1 Tax=Liparis tanakae TaxID=230148 RepID=A0A4Z2I289_9TELE|nr:hypothetical protein EYF80_017898 [Liparis tanakae]